MHFINTYVIKVYLKDFTNRCSWSKCFEDHSIGLFCFFYPHPRICLLILEKEGKGRTERNTDVRDIDQLPDACTPAEN